MSNDATSPETVELRYIRDIGELPFALRLSERLRRFVDRTGRFGSWMIVPLVFFTVMDVTIRKVGHFQMWMIEHFGRVFESTIVQELEWHFHTALFALVLGYGYIWNTHVRVDLVRESLHFRKKAWLELIGLVVFLIPFTATVIYFSAGYAYNSWEMNEMSPSTVGLTDRWIIKSVLCAGLIVALVAGFAVLLQVVTVLWGPQNIRFELMTLEWPEEEGSKIEGKERLDLERATDTLLSRAMARGHLGEEHAEQLAAETEAAQRKEGGRATGTGGR